MGVTNVLIIMNISLETPNIVHLMLINNYLAPLHVSEGSLTIQIQCIRA